MLLWLLAENKSRTHKDAFCIRQTCNGLGSCSKDQHNYAALPPSPETIPKYYREIVDVCRAKDPLERPTARELLYLFPPSKKPLFYQSKTPTLENTVLEGFEDALSGTIYCDVCCRANIKEKFVHCNVCNTSDLDICHRCYAAGLHCHQEEHLLVDLKKVGGWKVPWRYHSKVQSSGHRDVFEV